MNEQKKKDRRQEIQYIRELLNEVMKEEGYQIVGHYDDWENGKQWGSFEIPLRNGATNNDRLTVKVEWDFYE